MELELLICATVSRKFGWIGFEFLMGQIASDPLSRWYSKIERMQ
jgi:hypothetical protein